MTQSDDPTNGGHSRRKYLGMAAGLTGLIGFGSGSILAQDAYGGGGGTRQASSGAMQTQADNEFLEAIADDDFLAVVDSVTVGGLDEQLAVHSDSLQGFPLAGDSYGVMSSGVAAGVAGDATDFVSDPLGGEMETFFGRQAFDVVRLTVEFTVPEDAESVNFDFKFGTEENPSYLDSEFQDFFAAFLEGPDGYQENLALLPNCQPVTVDNANDYANSPGGSSNAPEAPLPDPNDVVFNSVTDLISAQSRADWTELGLQGEQVTLSLFLGDASDAILDAAVFLDNLTFGEPSGAVCDGPPSAEHPVPDDEEEPDEAEQATVIFDDQTSTGSSVVVDQVGLSHGGFVVLHDDTLVTEGDALGSVVGVSAYLDAGTTQNLEIALDDPLEESQTLWAMAHMDTNDNQTYDFADSGGQEDGPYTLDGDPVMDDACITIGC